MIMLNSGKHGIKLDKCDYINTRGAVGISILIRVMHLLFQLHIVWKLKCGTQNVLGSVASVSDS